MEAQEQLQDAHGREHYGCDDVSRALKCFLRGALRASSRIGSSAAVGARALPGTMVQIAVTLSHHALAFACSLTCARTRATLNEE
jgi:hypothetical protein